MRADEPSQPEWSPPFWPLLLVTVASSVAVAILLVQRSWVAAAAVFAASMIVEVAIARWHKRRRPR
jgi:hypothetical protein